jgi:FAD/FMN-containing dehydrogenase
MNDALHGEVLEAIEEIFRDRMKKGPVGDEGIHGEALAVVSPVNVREVELLAQLAGQHSLPLVALGARMAFDVPGAPEKSILINFDLMRDVRIRGGEDLWVRAEPGAPWLELENNLSTYGWGRAVYPTSAPRATVGGWLATDGLGVGSFEYGPERERPLGGRGVGGRRVPYGAGGRVAFIHKAGRHGGDHGRGDAPNPPGGHGRTLWCHLRRAGGSREGYREYLRAGRAAMASCLPGLRHGPRQGSQ